MASGFGRVDMRIGLVFAAMLSAAGPAMANDSTAETAAGGLVLTRSDAIDMVSEDLYVSAEKVRVAYVFRNRTPKDVRVTVAFPMPDRELKVEEFGDVAIPSDFVTRVDGAPVEMRVERKALLNGRDLTATVAGLHLPVVADDLGKRMDALPAPQRQQLVRLGLAEVDEYDNGKGMERHLFPVWTVRESWYWEQTFPAGRDLRVEHDYKPGTGDSVGTALAEGEFRRSPEGRAMIAKYCVDADFLGGVDRLLRAAPKDYRVLPEQRIAYILTTGANWRAPITDFRLVVDKGAAENIVSLCGDGIRKISPTRFELRRTKWRPTKDLDVLIVRPAPRAE
jgi:hypothetical protein